MLQRMRGSALVKLLVMSSVAIVVIGVVLIPGYFCSGRASNERNHTTSLKTLASAEADFRANDRDWNHVNDFWTADVKGLYTMTSTAVVGATPVGTTDPSIKLIELSLAKADADDAFHSAGGENVPLTTFALPMAKAGYWYSALKSDLSTTPATPYAQETEGIHPRPMGRVHNEWRFGFLSFPDSPSSGKYISIVNESNTIFRAAATASSRTNNATPPGVSGIPAAYLNWPDAKMLKAQWSKLD